MLTMGVFGTTKAIWLDITLSLFDRIDNCVMCIN